MSDEKTVRYSGASAVVSWHGGLCIHVGECGRAAGDLFVGGRQPWCQPDQSANEEVQDVVERCPTGALTVAFTDGSRIEGAATTNTVNVAYNGPLFVRGNLAIDGAPEDAPGLKFRAALCRCGQSKNKPFCDNSHEAAGFRDFGAVGESGKAAAESGGALNITAVRNGPLSLQGNMTLLASSGRAAWHGSKVVLCRCGASKNKPFCDGEHKKIGFESD